MGRSLPTNRSIDDSMIDLRSDSRRLVERPREVRPRPVGWLLADLRKPAAFLVPIRLFIGIGWLRAFAEKVTTGSWLEGRAVREFLDVQVASGSVVFRPYEWLIDSVLRPGSPLIGWLVVLLQLIVGLAILTGAYTNLALLVGIAMNVNFMLAGSISPSVFYIAIQTVLFVTGAGAVLGLDRLLPHGSRKDPSILLFAMTETRSVTRNDKIGMVALALFAIALSWLGFAHVDDFSPTGVTDPGLVLGTVMAVSALTMTILCLRLIGQRKPAGSWLFEGLEGPD